MFIQMTGVMQMKKCESCNVFVYDSESNCPLCHKFLGEAKSTAVEYPSYNSIIKEQTALKNIPLFLVLFINIICIFINMVTYDKGEVIWSIIVFASTFYIYFMYKIVSENMRYGKKIVLSYISLSSFLIIIDLTSGKLFWSTDYAFPFITMATVLYLTSLSIRNKQMFTEYFGFLLTVTSISLLSIISFLLDLSNSSWGPFVSILSSIIITLGLYLFSEKTLKEELKKRFNRK